MSEERSLELPKHVVVKIQKVLGVSPTSLPEHDLVSLIEDLCDTALMFDGEERGGDLPEEAKPVGARPGAALTQVVERPLSANQSEVEQTPPRHGLPGGDG